MALNHTRDNNLRAMDSSSRTGRDQACYSLHEQAACLLCSPSSQKAFCTQPETAGKYLTPVTIADGKSGVAGAEAQAVVGSSAALKGMNADADQVIGMMNDNPTPELFSELKDHDRQLAADFAVRNSAFQRQALHDMNDESFQEDVRARLTGTGRS